MKSLPEDKEFVSKRSICGFSVWCISVTVWYFICPIPVPHFETSLDKIVYTLRWLHLSMYTLLFGIMSIATTRFYTNAIDPLTGRGEHLVDIPQRYLRNTLEQIVLHIVGLLTLASYLPSYMMKIIPCCVLLFIAGRIAFFIGYRLSPLHRAFGFSLTFFGNVIVLVSCTICMFLFGPSGT